MAILSYNDLVAFIEQNKVGQSIITHYWNSLGNCYA